MPVMEEPAQEASRIEVEVQLGLDPIRGRVFDRSGSARRFSGWIELTSLLEALRAGSDSAETQQRRQT